MAVPLFVGAGSGSFATTGTGTVSKTSCTAGNLVFIHLVTAGTSADWSAFPSVTNIEMPDGTADDLDAIQTDQNVGAPVSYSHSLFIGRVMADGTCSADYTVGASGEDLFARLYEFSGEALGTTKATIIENGGSDAVSTDGTGATVDAGDCVTNDVDRLACSFVAIDVNRSIGDFSGESGGDWTEAVAEYAEAGGAKATLQLQTASIAVAGTITGGSAAITSSGWGIFTLAIIPAPAPVGATIAWITA